MNPYESPETLENTTKVHKGDSIPLARKLFWVIIALGIVGIVIGLLLPAVG